MPINYSDLSQDLSTRLVRHSSSAIYANISKRVVVNYVNN